VWGAKDEFAPVAGAYRFKKELPDAELVVLDDVGHFLMEDEPSRVASEIATFVATRTPEGQPAP
jgi:haloalkane dehalogenase